MCGIAGVARPDAGRAGAAPVPEGPLAALLAALAHRGPDGEGRLFRAGLALGHRRLAVIDAAGGAQPMSTLSGDLSVSFNGEIYNHVELRKQLEAEGAAFATRSDTEVLLHGWAAWGPDLLQRLRGMFAFALWDARRAELVLARDPLGQKPLYWARCPDGTLVFASEAAPLARWPELRAGLDPAALAAYVTFEYLPGERSIFAGVRKLEPGHWLRFARGEVALERYYRIPNEPTPTEGAEEDLVAHLDAAVERCLVADVPLGIFLSGGLDSASVLASAARLRDPRTLETFTIGFDDPDFDESPVARRVAAHFGTNHHERSFSTAEVLERVPRVIATLDEPLGDPSYLPTHLLCEFARERVTVALGGDGADELLYGYGTFRAERAASVYARAPRWLRTVFRAGVERLPVGSGYMSADFVARRFVDAADAPPAERHPRWLASAWPGAADDPLHPELRRHFPVSAVLAPALRAYDESGAGSHLERVSRQYATTYLPDDILHKTDRASMARSLELRAPFLERELVAFLAGLPPRAKLDARGRSKAILRRALRTRLPAELFALRKRGFAIPIARWLRGPLAGLCAQKLARERIARAGWFDAATVERLRLEHASGRRDHRKILWTLLVFELWRERHGVGGR